METIKEEKKADLEQLLNSLIEKGWEPRGYYESDGKKLNFVKFREKYELYKGNTGIYAYSARELTSIDSGLWQFVCENGMVKGHKHERILDPTFGEGWADCKRQEHDGNYGYRLIESALKDESELEDFLLNSIKLD